VGAYDFKKAKAELSRNPWAVCVALGCAMPQAKGGDYWFIQPKRFSDATTFWVARHDGSFRHEGKNVGGDIIELIAYVLDKPRFEALKWAYVHLGWEAGQAGEGRGLTDAEIIARDEEARRKQAEQAARREARGQRMASHWAGLPAAQGTIVETYLRDARRLAIDLLSHFPGCLKFEPVAEHTCEETGEVTEWPAMVALLARDGKRGGTGIHRTFLRPDGSGKAPVKPAKIMVGIKKGSAIRLARGLGDLSPRDAMARGHKCPLIIGEGIETTLKVAAFMLDCRAWAAGDMGNMAALAWPPYASDIILLKDNNLHPPGSKAFEAAEAGWRRVENHWRDLEAQNAGRLIIAPPSAGFSDFADETE